MTISKLPIYKNTIYRCIYNQTYLFSGRNKDGTEKYIRWGKQFREFPELLFDDNHFNPDLISSYCNIRFHLTQHTQLSSIHINHLND